MTFQDQVILWAALALVLSIGFSWVFAFLYVFMQDFDKQIFESRVNEFRVAGAIFGIGLAMAITWAISRGA